MVAAFKTLIVWFWLLPQENGCVLLSIAITIFDLNTSSKGTHFFIISEEISYVF
jgi:hypothetical protein